MPKRVMGVDVPSAPPRAPVRFAAPLPPPKAPLRVEAAQEDTQRSLMPPGTVRFSGPYGVSFKGHSTAFLGGLLIVGVLVGVVYFVRGTVDRLEAKLDALEQRMKTADDAYQREASELRSHVQALQLYTHQSVGLTAQVVQKLGGKLEFAPGAAPPDPGWHPSPLRVGPAPVQPRAVLPAPPAPPETPEQ